MLSLYRHRSLSVINQCYKILTYGNIAHFHTSIRIHEKAQVRDGTFKKKIEEGPSLQEFIRNSQEVGNVSEIQTEEFVPYLQLEDLHGQNRKGNKVNDLPIL